MIHTFEQISPTNTYNPIVEMCNDSRYYIVAIASYMKLRKQDVYNRMLNSLENPMVDQIKHFYNGNSNENIGDGKDVHTFSIGNFHMFLTGVKLNKNKILLGFKFNIGEENILENMDKHFFREFESMMSELIKKNKKKKKKIIPGDGEEKTKNSDLFKNGT